MLNETIDMRSLEMDTIIMMHDTYEYGRKCEIMKNIVIDIYKIERYKYKGLLAYSKTFLQQKIG